MIHPHAATEEQVHIHIGHHLKNNVTVKCFFTWCDHQTNVYGTFATHTHSRHTPHTSQDFKTDIFCQRQVIEQEETLVSEASEEDNDALCTSKAEV